MSESCSSFDDVFDSVQASNINLVNKLKKLFISHYYFSLNFYKNEALIKIESLNENSSQLIEELEQEKMKNNNLEEQLVSLLIIKKLE